MSLPTLTPDAKRALRDTIGNLRAQLIEGFRNEAETTYLLRAPARAAKLPEAAAIRRRRLDDWIDGQVRTTPEAERKKKSEADLRKRFFEEAVKQAASTFLHRLILLRVMEALSAGRPRGERLVAHDVVTKGWQSPAYREFREFAPALCQDRTEGYATLLVLVFEELALDLPGLYGEVGLTRLFPIPADKLRATIEALNNPELDTAWTDDTTLGWVYQYWNDPDREALDRKLNDGEKIEPHEIASKTQMFTERYMVEWLLHNSLGLQWLCICKQHGWTPDAASVLDDLDKRRVDWRGRRDREEVALDALMPIHGDLEEHWKYYVPQPIPDDMVAKVPGSVRDLKILDPACGSGHFLVIAFELLVALYREEARHRGVVWTDREIAEGILENNLHGVDIDPRAVQIAAASLFVKARAFAPDVRPKKLNLVAPALRLGRLPANDPALEKLRRELRTEVGIPDELTNKIVQGLQNVDHLGTLLKVDRAIKDALRDHERVARAPSTQGDLLTRSFPAVQTALPLGEARASVLEKLEPFLARHAREDDLGLRLDGEQIAAGVRFVRMVKEGTYDLVVGNPPYQGTSRMADARYVADKYPIGKADLFAAFLERGIELARDAGISAMVTMRGWMFLGQYKDLRERLLVDFDLAILADLDSGAFEEVSAAQVVLAVSMSVFARGRPRAQGVALRPTPFDDRASTGMVDRKRLGLMLQADRYDFKAESFAAIAGKPIVYWWTLEFLERYAVTPKLGLVHSVRQGLATGNNARYLRRPWEVDTHHAIAIVRREYTEIQVNWSPYIKGAEGSAWFESVEDVIRWASCGLEKRVASDTFGSKAGNGTPSRHLYFRRGVAFSMIGSGFTARVHRYPSIVGHMGSSVYGENLPDLVCLMNSETSRDILSALNPGLHFEVGDVNRLPIFPVAGADDIYAALEVAFGEHEATREASIEFRRPGRCAWDYAQSWAQRAVDRRPDESLPAYEPTYEEPDRDDFLSFAAGVALGRFGANGEGLLDTAPSSALPAGILYVSPSRRDALTHPATALLRATWTEQSRGDDDTLRDWLRKDFFADHKKRYENRPIYFPLSSAKKSFVAWVSIHRFGDTTLQTLLADALVPDRTTLDGELADLRAARTTGDKESRQRAERRFSEVKTLLEELDDFIAKVTQCAEKGPPNGPDGPNPPEKDIKPREVDARFVMDLDDGVMVNSAALWPLLEPQWKDPKKWWKELAASAGKKDYDWAHLAARYFPKRVDGKCRLDPSLAVAHRCFWRYHPAKAYAWELRLQDEIGPDFLIEEPDAAEHRAIFLEDHPQQAHELVVKEELRREKKRRKDEGAEQAELRYEQGETDADETGEAEADV